MPKVTPHKLDLMCETAASPLIHTVRQQTLSYEDLHKFFITPKGAVVMYFNLQ